jgi:hypothetical protein
MMTLDLDDYDDLPRADSLTKDEFFDVVRSLGLGWSREKFESQWSEFNTHRDKHNAN